MPVVWFATSYFSAIVWMVLRVFSGIICNYTAHLSWVSMASRNCCFIGKSDIIFLGRLDRRFFSLMMTSVIGCTLPSCVYFTDSHIYHRSSDEVDGRKYVSKHFLSSGMVFLSSTVSVLNISNWSTALLLQYAP
jgi:hypothetical protein